MIKNIQISNSTNPNINNFVLSFYGYQCIVYLVLLNPPDTLKKVYPV